MRVDSDDDALSWGDDDPSHVAGPSTKAPRQASGEPVRASSAILVAYGVIAGIFLIYSVGWFIAVERDDFTQPGLFAEIMFQLGEFLAIASPLLWMAAVLVLVARPSHRLAWLGLGVLVLVPWPFVMGA
ncbi:hypothetical protein FVA74_04440 [Salinibacterium sp. dk2585]|uniref:hypothetical protein n=1 Tax=unclassified Salinibacterium TaxID=2632331 RepID=UPI0011C24FB2|nr:MULTISPECIES: hypothetical protein [unclassified Salinibacterium]QEE60912.1 hypothetical protein FVA74_04440 [Salinibacterium sp. dk2585]TXK55983.1 hypothetical protein FVP63_04585 [Salinibacterium sp. dk5596]